MTTKPTTLENLQEAFAGESMANRKYLAFAKKAETDGFKQVGKLFRCAAEAETVHALGHFNSMGGVKTTAENLESAIAGETHEFAEMYPSMIEQAEAEKHRGRGMLKMACAAEKVHAELYTKALEAVRDGKDLPENMDIFYCPVCGYVEWNPLGEKCPICIVHKEIGGDGDLITSLCITIKNYKHAYISDCKETLVKEISDLLYDELIFAKVLQKVDRKYTHEIQELQEEQKQLQTQRQADLATLRGERLQRLNPLSNTFPLPTSAFENEERMSSALSECTEVSRVATKGSESLPSLSDPEAESSIRRPRTPGSWCFDSDDGDLYELDPKFFPSNKGQKSPKKSPLVENGDKITVDDLPDCISGMDPALLEQLNRDYQREQCFLENHLPDIVGDSDGNVLPQAHPIVFTSPQGKTSVVKNNTRMEPLSPQHIKWSQEKVIRELKALEDMSASDIEESSRAIAEIWEKPNLISHPPVQEPNLFQDVQIRDIPTSVESSNAQVEPTISSADQENVEQEEVFENAEQNTITNEEVQVTQTEDTKITQEEGILSSLTGSSIVEQDSQNQIEESREDSKRDVSSTSDTDHTEQELPCRTEHEQKEEHEQMEKEEITSIESSQESSIQNEQSQKLDECRLTQNGEQSSDSTQTPEKEEDNRTKENEEQIEEDENKKEEEQELSCTSTQEEKKTTQEETNV